MNKSPPSPSYGRVVTLAGGVSGVTQRAARCLEPERGNSKPRARRASESTYAISAGASDNRSRYAANGAARMMGASTGLGIYPPGWEHPALTSDRLSYRIRPIRPDDAQRELDFLTALSPESRYTRVMGARSLPSPEQLERLVRIDYRTHMAFVAVVADGTDERIIGVARYALDGPRSCEFAIVVADEWQHRGVGKALSRTIIDYARAGGIDEIHASMLATNYHMIELARALGMSVQRDREEPRLVRATRPT